MVVDNNKSVPSIMSPLYSKLPQQPTQKKLFLMNKATHTQSVCSLTLCVKILDLAFLKKDCDRDLDPKNILK